MLELRERIVMRMGGLAAEARTLRRGHCPGDFPRFLCSFEIGVFDLYGRFSGLGATVENVSIRVCDVSSCHATVSAGRIGSTH
jgi:hypothetical protein